MLETQNQSSSSTLLKWLVAILVSLLSIPVFLGIIFAAGQYQGTEFSPDNFSTRVYTYNKTPWLNWVIKKKTYKDITGGVEADLIADGLIKVRFQSPRAWHLVTDMGSTRNGLDSHDCDARFLTGYLELTNDEGEYFWSIWNDDHPKSAIVFWPMVAELARAEMYLKIPDVMQFAMKLENENVNVNVNEKEKDDSVAFRARLEKLVAQCYLDMGILDLQMNRYSRAKDRLSRSFALVPTEEAKTHLAACLEKLSSEKDADVGNPTEDARPVDDKVDE